MVLLAGVIVLSEMGPTVDQIDRTVIDEQDCFETPLMLEWTDYKGSDTMLEYPEHKPEAYKRESLQESCRKISCID